MLKFLLVLLMPTYFGTCDAAGVNSLSTVDDSAGWFWRCDTGASFTCPGSGPQAVVELSAWVGVLSGTPNIRLALYNSSGNRVCQGTGEVVVTDGYSWQGHMNAAALTPNPTTITGGQQYRIGVARDSSGVLDTYSGIVTLGNVDYHATQDLTGGWPSTIPADTDYTAYLSSVRVGVNAGINLSPATGLATLTGFVPSLAATASAVLSGTITSATTETDIVTGGKTIIITVAGTQWIP